MASTIIASSKEANDLHKELIKGNNFTPPTFDWKDLDFKLPDEINGDIGTVTVDDLTTRKFSGKGVFDALAESVYNHIDKDYQDGRITKDDYSKIYTSLLEASMGNAVQFLLNKDQSYWAAITAKTQAMSSYVQLQIAKAQLATQMYSMLTEEAKFANTKMGTLNLESAYKVSEFNLGKILPANEVLIKEQGEAQRAQTLDERSDKLVVKGVLGKQKDLYSQQIESYKRDAEYKVGKFYVDAFTVIKTIDEGALAPNEFTASNIDSIIREVKTKVGL